MTRLHTGIASVAEMWIELLGLGDAGWPGVAAVVTLLPIAILVTPITFVAEMVRGP